MNTWCFVSVAFLVAFALPWEGRSLSGDGIRLKLNSSMPDPMYPNHPNVSAVCAKTECKQFWFAAWPRQQELDWSWSEREWPHQNQRQLPSTLDQCCRQVDDCIPFVRIRPMARSSRIPSTPPPERFDSDPSSAWLCTFQWVLCSADSEDSVDIHLFLADKG